MIVIVLLLKANKITTLLFLQPYKCFRANDRRETLLYILPTGNSTNLVLCWSLHNQFVTENISLRQRQPMTQTPWEKNL